MLPFDDYSQYSLDELKALLAPGYRSVVYTTDPINKHGYLYCRMYDISGNPLDFRYKYRCRLGYVVNDKSLPDIDIYGRHIKYIDFKSLDERKKWINDNEDLVTIVDCIAPENDFLARLFWDVTEDNSFNKLPWRVHYLDIETEISAQFEYPITARNRINMITVYDNTTDKFYTWSLQSVNKSSIINDNRHIVFDTFNDNEHNMLSHYLNWHIDNMPDAFAGWNIYGYDIPYIVRRMENVLGKNQTKHISPMDAYRIKELGEPENPNRPDSQGIEVHIKGIAQMDELLLYRDKFKVKQALQGGYNLSNVGQAEKLGKKITYEGTLKDLYLKDWDKFYTYNVQDVQLAYDIDNKIKLLDLARQIVSCGLIGDYEQIYGTLVYIVGSLYVFAKKHCNNIVFPTYTRKANLGDDVKYEGAYVFPCTAGLYDGGIATIDFASLYPSVIRATNISPDTYVGKILNMDYDPIVTS